MFDQNFTKKNSVVFSTRFFKFNHSKINGCCKDQSRLHLDAYEPCTNIMSDRSLGACVTSRNVEQQSSEKIAIVANRRDRVDTEAKRQTMLARPASVGSSQRISGIVFLVPVSCAAIWRMLARAPRRCAETEIELYPRECAADVH